MVRDRPVAIFSIKTIFVKKVMTVLPVVLALLPPVVVVLTALFPVVVLTAALVVVVLTALVVVVLTVALTAALTAAVVTAALTAAVVTAALTAALADADEGRLQEVEKKKACVSKYVYKVVEDSLGRNQLRVADDAGDFIGRRTRRYEVAPPPHRRQIRVGASRGRIE
jgi:hypothetical protein